MSVEKDKPIPSAQKPGENVLLELSQKQELASKNKNETPLEKLIEESAEQGNIGGG